MSKNPQFQIFRYQILPIAREFQSDMFDPAKTLEQLLAQKNAIFWKALTAVKNFSSTRVTLEHKVLNETNDSRLYKLAVSRNLDRETKDFRHERVDNWPSFLAFIWNAPDKQFIAIEKRYAAFQLPETAIRQIMTPVEKTMAKSNLRVHWEPLFEERLFWEIIERNRGKIQEVRFELVTPNMANISQTLSEEIKTFAKSTNSATTAIEIHADPASSLKIQKDNQTIANLVDYSSKGGGNVGIRLKGIKRVIQTSKTVKTIEIEQVEAADAPSAVAVLKTLLDK